jgi:hypothetical protein
MKESIIGNEKWTPSFKQYYKTYHSSAKFIGLNQGENMQLDYKWQEHYRCRRSYEIHPNGRKFGLVPGLTIYTNNLELLDELLTTEYYKQRLDYVSTPRDQEHLNALISSDERLIFRSKLFFNEYSYRVQAEINYYRNPPQTETVEDAVKFVEENFANSRLVYNQGRLHWPGGFRHSWYNSPYLQQNNNIITIPKFPTIYTNDVNSLFLLKLSWGTDLSLLTERVMII